MRLLLDTHVALWAVLDPQRLSASVRSWLIDPANDVAFSIATLWEIAIKRSTRPGRPDTPKLSAHDAKSAFVDADFEILSLNPDHVEMVEALPFHHHDPFDRLLVAQARCEGMTLLTRDKVLVAYGDHVAIV